VRLVAIRRPPGADKKIVVQFGMLPDGAWDGNKDTDKGPMVPYRLPDLLAAPASPVFICEGEKDADTLANLGHLATTNPNGAMTWSKDLNKHFSGRAVIIVPDADKTGEERIGMLCDQLAGIASSIKIVRLPGLEFKEKHGEDITDWIEKHGHTNEEFIELARKAPDYADESPRLVETSAEFIATFIPPDYAIDGLVQQRFCYSLTAPTGHGKTAVALLISACKALGLPIGSRAVDPGRVLYFAGENPDDVRMRWIALADKMGFDPETIGVHFVSGVKKLSEIAPRIWQEVECIGGVSLVVVDTSAAFFEGDEENGNVQAGTHARMMRSLVSLPGGPCVLIMCHPVKNATQDNLLPRGGGAFLAEVDGNLTCWKTDSLVTLHWQGKFRGPDFAPITFQLETVTSMSLKDSKGRLIPSVIAKALSDKERGEAEASSRGDEDAVLLALAENDRLSMAGLASVLGWKTHAGEPNKSKAQRLVDRLKKGKLVEVDRSGIALAAKGKEEAKRLKLNADLAGARYG
jgi:5S rRNA maturation endonuclease (ribonuclease M5)